MRINKKAENITFTSCDLCGSIVGGKGRLDLSINFDDDFVRMDEDLDTSISANICTSCAKKLVQNIAGKINNTEDRIIEIKAQIGFGFNTAISSISSNPVIEAPNDEIVEAETIEEEDEIEEETEKPSENIIPTVQFDSIQNIEPCAVFNDESKKILAVFCEIYKGQIKNVQQFVNDFVNEFPVFTDIIGPMTSDRSIEYIRKIIRDNSDYRLKVFGSGWFLQYLLESTVVKEETKNEEIAEPTVKRGSTRRSWTEDEIKFLLDNYTVLGAKLCAERLGRARTAVVKKYQVLMDGSNPNATRRWTEEETSFLLENFNSIGANGCSELLNRTPQACYARYRYVTQK